MLLPLLLNNVLTTGAVFVPCAAATGELHQVLVDDMALFFGDDNDFATCFNHASVTGFGIFDGETTEGNERINPVLWVQSSLVTGVVDRGDQLGTNGTTYEIIGLKPDGVGVTQITLEIRP